MHVLKIGLVGTWGKALNVGKRSGAFQGDQSQIFCNKTKESLAIYSYSNLWVVREMNVMHQGHGQL